MPKLQFIPSDSLHVRPDAEIVVEYFHQLTTLQSSWQVLNTFRMVLIEDGDCPNKDIRKVIDSLAYSLGGEKEFFSLLNRCTQTLISQWYEKAESRAMIVQLFAVFEQLPSTNKFSKNQQKWAKKFLSTPMYLKLKRLTHIIEPVSPEEDKQCLGHQLSRYPFLYKYCLLSDDSSRDYRYMIGNFKTKNRQRFEIKLVKYGIYCTRLLQIIHAGQLTTGAGRLLHPVENPTLLDERETNLIIKEFTNLFKSHAKITACLIDKNSLIEYLISNMGKAPEQSIFKQYFRGQLQEILSHEPSQTLTETSYLRIGRQLLNNLVFDNSQPAKHLQLVNLTANLGITETVSLLMKLILLCPKLKPYLDKQLALLFEYYEGYPKEQVDWFVKLLETFLIVYTLCAKTVDISSTQF